MTSNETTDSLMTIFIPYHIAGASKNERVLMMTGYINPNYQYSMSVLDMEYRRTCTLVKNYEVPVAYAAGGLVKTDQGVQPLLCGGYTSYTPPVYDQCLLGTSNKDTWQNLCTLPEGRTYMTAVPIADDLILFSGGLWNNDQSNETKIFNETFLLSKDGITTPLEDLSEARELACSAVIHEDGNRRTVAVIGGQSRNTTDLKSIELYNCTVGKSPDCTKIDNGPDMPNSRSSFGCGTLQTSNVSIQTTCLE